MAGNRCDNLQAQRISAGLSIGNLAKKANVSDHTVRTLENGGTCSPREAQQIADALGISFGTLGVVHLK